MAVAPLLPYHAVHELTAMVGHQMVPTSTHHEPHYSCAHVCRLNVSKAFAQSALDKDQQKHSDELLGSKLPQVSVVKQ